MGKSKFEIGEPVGQSCSGRYRCLVSGSSVSDEGADEPVTVTAWRTDAIC